MVCVIIINIMDYRKKIIVFFKILNYFLIYLMLKIVFFFEYFNFIIYLEVYVFIF